MKLNFDCTMLVDVPADDRERVIGEIVNRYPEVTVKATESGALEFGGDDMTEMTKAVITTLSLREGRL